MRPQLARGSGGTQLHFMSENQLGLCGKGTARCEPSSLGCTKGHVSPQSSVAIWWVGPRERADMDRRGKQGQVFRRCWTRWRRPQHKALAWAEDRLPLDLRWGVCGHPGGGARWAVAHDHIEGPQVLPEAQAPLSPPPPKAGPFGPPFYRQGPGSSWRPTPAEPGQEPRPTCRRAPPFPRAHTRLGERLSRGRFPPPPSLPLFFLSSSHPAPCHPPALWRPLCAGPFQALGFSAEESPPGAALPGESEHQQTLAR